MSRFLKVIAGAVIFASILSLNGCSSGSSGNGAPPTGGISGGLKTAKGTATETKTLGAAGTSTPVQVTFTDPTTGVTSTKTVQVISGTTSGTTVTPDTPLLVIPAGTKPIALANTTTVKVAVANDLAAAQAVLAAGNSAITVNPDGSIAVDIAIPLNQPDAAPGSRAATPVTLLLPQGNVNTTRELTFQSFAVNGTTYVLRNGDGTVTIVSPFPTNIGGTIPQNGQNTAGSSIVATYGAGNAGRETSLVVQYDASNASNTGATIQSNLTATYNGRGKNTVSSTGVQSITINVGPLPGQ